jgi:hypothetical protein
MHTNKFIYKKDEDAPYIVLPTAPKISGPARADWRHYSPLWLQRRDEAHQLLDFRAGARRGRVSSGGTTRPLELRPFAASCTHAWTCASSYQTKASHARSD